MTWGGGHETEALPGDLRLLPASGSLPHTGRPSWPHSLGTNGLWLQPVTLAGPVAAGGTEGVPRACLCTSAVRSETGVQ